MKKVLLSMAVLSSLAFASIPPQGDIPPQGQIGSTFDVKMFKENKVELLKNMEINHKARMKCMGAAENPEEMRICNEQSKEMIEKQKQERLERMQKLMEEKPRQPMQPMKQ